MSLSIDDVINPSLVVLDLKSSDRDAAIAEMADRLVADGRVTDREAFVDVVRRREQESPTGMEMGVAIPHGKSPAVARAGVVFARSAQGIDFGSDEGVDSRLLFLIAAPDSSDDLHVTLLSKLARKLIHEDFRTALAEAQTEEQAMEVLRQEVTL